MISLDGFILVEKSLTKTGSKGRCKASRAGGLVKAGHHLDSYDCASEREVNNPPLKPKPNDLLLWPPKFGSYAALETRQGIHYTTTE